MKVLILQALLAVISPLYAMGQIGVDNYCVRCHSAPRQVSEIVQAPRQKAKSNAADTRRFKQARHNGLIKVRKGDNLSLLALKVFGYAGEWPRLAVVNGINPLHPRALRIGETLLIQDAKKISRKAVSQTDIEQSQLPISQAVAEEFPLDKGPVPSPVPSVVNEAAPIAVSPVLQPEEQTAIAEKPADSFQEVSAKQSGKEPSASVLSNKAEDLQSPVGTATVDSNLQSPGEAAGPASAGLRPQVFISDRRLNFNDLFLSSSVLGASTNGDTKINDDFLKINGEIGYFWGCLDMIGKCQGFGGSLDIYKNSQSRHKLGLEIGGEITLATLTDTESSLTRRKYSVFAGIPYMFETENDKLVVKNGVMYQSTDDDTVSVGMSMLNVLPPDTQIGGVDLSKFKYYLSRSQKDVMYYTSADYTHSFENWRLDAGFKLLLPISEKTETEYALYLPKIDQTLALARFGVQKKIGEETFLGIETFPVYYSGETNMLAAKASLDLNWKKLYFEGGILMYPYGLSDIANERGGSFQKLMNAYLAFKVIY